MKMAWFKNKKQIIIDVDTLTRTEIVPECLPFVRKDEVTAAAVGMALVDQITELSRALNGALQTISDQEKIITSLNAEIGDMLRKKEEVKDE